MSASGGDKGGEDPFAAVRDAYGQVVENWAAAMERVVTTDEFAEASGRFLRQYAELNEAGRSATRATADQLHLATKDDVARTVQLVAQLERKVDEVSDDVHAIRQSIAAIEASLAALADGAAPAPKKKRPAGTSGSGKKRPAGASGSTKKRASAGADPTA